MHQMSHSTITELIADLQQQGYTDDLVCLPHAVECRTKAVALLPEQFHVDSFHRFEGDTDPADEAIVYAISSASLGVKGILINGYGASSDTLTAAMVEKLSVR
jgi:hypothetical protein